MASSSSLASVFLILSVLGVREALDSISPSMRSAIAAGIGLFSPIIGMIGNYLPITAPALIIVAAMMMSNASRIEWADSSESVPAFLTMVGIPLAYSIADGLALGFICYPVLKVLTGRGPRDREDGLWHSRVARYLLCSRPTHACVE